MDRDRADVILVDGGGTRGVTVGTGFLSIGFKGWRGVGLDGVYGSYCYG